jgi:hypothetical protein
MKVAELPSWVLAVLAAYAGLRLVLRHYFPPETK